MVSRNHILTLVNAAASVEPGRHYSGMSWYVKHHGKHAVSYSDDARKAEVAQMLWNENRASINARYPDTIKNPEAMPGPIGEDYIINPKDFRVSIKHTDPIAILRACDCYAYQACEHVGWTDSEAYAFIQALRDKMIRRLPGYDSAPWEIE